MGVSNKTVQPVVYGKDDIELNASPHSWMFKLPAGKRVSDLSTKQLMDIGYFDE